MSKLKAIKDVYGSQYVINLDRLVSAKVFSYLNKNTICFRYDVGSADTIDMESQEAANTAVTSIVETRELLS